MSKTPVVRPVSWLNAGVTFCILGIFAFVAWTLDRRNGIVWGVFAFIVVSQILRRTIPRHHRKAIRFCKRQQFEAAIPEFEKSIEFFSEHPWIDKFRAITILSAAGMSYREMAMVSVGFCYAQLGDGTNARRSYQQSLKEYPDNCMAQSALRMLDAGANAEKSILE